MKHLLVVAGALVLTPFLVQSARTIAQVRASPDQAVLEIQPNFAAAVRMKSPSYDCVLEYGTLVRVGDKARVDVRPVLGKGRRIDCNPGAPIYGVTFPIGERFLSDTITVLDHKNRTFDDSREGHGVPVLAPYALMMGWLASGSVSSRGMYVEGECVVNGHPCVVISDQKAGDKPWTRYYAAKDLKNLVIRIEWWSEGEGGGLEGLMPQFVPLSGEIELSDIVLDPPATAVAIPVAYRRARAR